MESQDARQFVAELDDNLNRLWRLGSHMLLGWTEAGDGIAVLFAPFDRLVDVIALEPGWLSEPYRMTPDTLKRASEELGIKPRKIATPVPVSQNGGLLKAVESLAARYGVARTDHRAAALFEIAGYEELPALDQVLLISNLSYSINVAHARLTEAGFEADLGRANTPAGIMIWNRHDGVAPDVHLFYLMILALADNALKAEAGGETPVPKLRTAFHIGPGYEFHQPQGLAPGVFNLIFGGLVTELRNILAFAHPGQILVSDFRRPIDDLGPTTQRRRRTADTPQFIALAQREIDGLGEIILENEKVSGLKCYLTGRSIGGGAFNILQYRASDDRGHSRLLFNLKLNIHRVNTEPLYIGMQHNDLEGIAWETTVYDPEPPP